MSEVLQLFNSHANKAVAHIQLNGPRPRSGNRFQPTTSARDFTIIAGDLWLEWFEQASLELELSDGEQVRVMVTALPDSSGAGVMHFL